METYLTDQQLNEEICKWRGWEILEAAGTAKAMYREQLCNGASSTDWKLLPNHITGIEALGHMHEAEKGLDERQYIQWAIHLNQLWLDDNHGSYIIRSASATARQRAIALLRVVKPGVFV